MALFRATSAHRISAFRAFPSLSAATSREVRCSLDVEPALLLGKPEREGPCFVAPQHGPSAGRPSPDSLPAISRSDSGIIRKAACAEAPEARAARGQNHPRGLNARRILEIQTRPWERPAGALQSRHEPSTSEPSSGKESVLALQVLTRRGADALLTFSPLGLTSTTVGPKPSPPVLSMRSLP